MKKPDIPVNEAERLLAVAEYQILDTLPEQTFDALTRIAAHLFGVPISFISIIDADRQWFKSHHGLDISETSRDVSFCAHVTAANAPLIVPDASLDARFADNPLVKGAPGIRFYAGFPLRCADGPVLGALCVIDRSPRAPSPQELQFLELLAGQAVNLLELRREARLAQERQQRLQSVLDTAFDAIIMIDQTGTIDQVNPATERMFGLSLKELVGSNIRALMPSNLRELHDRGMSNYLLTGERKVIGKMRELAGLHKDGRTFPIDAMVSELYVGSQRLFTGVLRDATQRKEAEHKLNSTILDLSRSRDDLLRVLNGLRIGTLMLDQNGSVAFANHASMYLCGFDYESAIDQPWEDVIDVGEQDRQLIRAMRRLPERDRRRLEMRVGVSRGSPRWVEIDLRDDPRDPERQAFFLYDTTEIHDARKKLAQERGDQMVGDSPAMKSLYDLIERVSAGDWTVLVEGETGVGKELVARAIHAASPRRDRAFVAINCAGLTDSLLGSQLFGHVKGAFTGAITNQTGLFEAASGGTLFLDEIGDISATLQAALLRVLQDREIVRVGETRSRKVDTRIILATNRDLRKRVALGEFREDLLYRIRGVRVEVPPLRKRREDIPQLVSAFLGQQRITGGRLGVEVSATVMRQLVAYDWPGNVRELRAMIEYAIVHCKSNCIELEDLPPEILVAALPDQTRPITGNEREQISEALRRTEGNRSKAARLLDISRATLYRRLKELGFDDKGTV